MDDGDWAAVGFGNLQTWGSLTEGQHTLHVKAVDKASNEVTATRMFYVDTSAPEVIFTTPDNNTAFRDNTPEIAWTGTDAGPGTIQFDIWWDMGPYTSIGNAEYYTFGSPLADGAHTFNVMASDEYGHASIYFIHFYVDTVAPTLDSVSPANGTTVIVRDVPISWYAFDMATSPSGLDRTEVKLDSGEWGSAGLTSGLTILGMDEGHHILYLRTFDKAGNMVSQTSHFTVDYALPTVSISSPSNHTIYSVNSVPIAWSGNDSGSGIDHYGVSVDSAAMTDVGTATSRTVQNLGEGHHTINVMAFDRSGKVRSAYIDVNIDMMAPTVSITSPTAGGFYASATINATWTVMEYGSGLASYETKMDDAAWQSRGATAYAVLTMAEGHHTLYVKAIDLAGNSRSASVNFTVDLNPPVINSLTPANGLLVNSTTVVFGWNVSDVIGVGSITYSIDSDTGHGLMSDITSASLTLTNGAHSFKLTVRDLQGRETVGYVNLTVDSVAPTVTTHSPTSLSYSSAVKLYFGFSENVDVSGMSVMLNGQSASFVLNGTVYELSTTLSPGTSYLVAISGAKDVAGNIMDAFSWTTAIVSGQQLPGQVLVSGTMVDKNGQPVSGAVVTIGGQTATTNAQGQFSIYVDPGQLQLHGTAVGMMEFTRSVNAATDQQLGQMAMTSTSDSTAPDATSSPTGDMTLLLIIGAVVVIVALVAVIMVRKKHKG